MADSTIRESDDRKNTAAAPRFWYGGTQMLETGTIEALEAADPKPRVAYDQQAGKQLGPWVSMMTRLRSQLLGLQPQSTMRAAPTAEKRLHHLLVALATFCETPKDRLAVLKNTGTFHFRRGLSAEARKAKLQAALANPADETDGVACAQQVRELAEIWSPASDSLLDSIINRPVEAGRTLAKRLDPGHTTRLSIFDRTVAQTDPSVQYPLVETNTVAYERAGAIHLLNGVQEHLDEWQAGKSLEDGGRFNKTFSIFETLILHEVVEVVLDETTDLDRLSAHVVAATFERSIHGDAVAQAVAEYCAQWAAALQPAVVKFVEEAELDGVAGEVTDALTDKADNADGDSEEVATWTDYLITHEELRPEAYEMRTYQEQQEILLEMFGEEVTIGEDLAA